MSDPTRISTAIRQFIRESFHADDGSGDIGDDFPLLGAGVIDSVSMLMLINYIEDTFDVSFEIDEIVRERFNTIRSITDLVMEKRGRKA